MLSFTCGLFGGRALVPEAGPNGSASALVSLAVLNGSAAASGVAPGRRLRQLGDGGLCLTMEGQPGMPEGMLQRDIAATMGFIATVRTCNSTDLSQVWSFNETSQSSGYLYNGLDGSCITAEDAKQEEIYVRPCLWAGESPQQSWYWENSTQHFINERTGRCLGSAYATAKQQICSLYSNETKWRLTGIYDPI